LPPSVLYESLLTELSWFYSVGKNSQDALAQRNRRQQQAELDYYQTFLGNLLRLLSDSKLEKVDEIIKIIRSGASHEEIFNAARKLNHEVYDT
jgi:hypothetical protein